MSCVNAQNPHAIMAELHETQYGSLRNTLLSVQVFTVLCYFSRLSSFVRTYVKVLEKQGNPYIQLNTKYFLYSFSTKEQIYFLLIGLLYFITNWGEWFNSKHAFSASLSSWKTSYKVTHKKHFKWSISWPEIPELPQSSTNCSWTLSDQTGIQTFLPPQIHPSII